MTTLSETFRHNLTEVLARHRVDMNVEEFVEILVEATEDTESLTAEEQRFLGDYSGAPRDAVDQGHQAAHRGRIVTLTALADAEALRDGLTTAEVAHRYGVAPSNIRRQVGQLALFVAGRTRRREHVFPRWQFTSDGPLPGLREVLAALPGDFHPLDVASFMTTPLEELGDRSPRDWLASGGDSAKVVQAAEDLARA